MREIINNYKENFNENLKILDASAFIHGYNPMLEEGEHFTTNNIVEEVKTKEDIVFLSIESNRVKIMEPSAEILNMVKETALKTGDAVSDNDMEILALSIQLFGILYTDDYGIQNVAKKFEIIVKNINMEGIKKEFIWRKMCKGCKKLYNVNYSSETCEICGAELVRKMVKKRIDKKNTKNNVKKRKSNKKYKKDSNEIVWK
nr:ribonuclease VapC [Methanococcus voltae]